MQPVSPFQHHHFHQHRDDNDADNSNDFDDRDYFATEFTEKMIWVISFSEEKLDNFLPQKERLKFCL